MHAVEFDSTRREVVMGSVFIGVLCHGLTLESPYAKEVASMYT